MTGDKCPRCQRIHGIIAENGKPETCDPCPDPALAQWGGHVGGCFGPYADPRHTGRRLKTPTVNIAPSPKRYLQLVKRSQVKR